MDFTEARVGEWQWHQLGHMQVCTSLQADNHASTPPLSFLQAGCPSCHPTNSVKALKARRSKNVKTDMLRSIGKQSGESVLKARSKKNKKSLRTAVSTYRLVDRERESSHARPQL